MKIPMGLLAVVVGVIAVPGGAGAEYLIPPGNSAATQYTEAYPTAGGQHRAGGNRGGTSPAKALGADNARRLEAQGPDGGAAAAVAAETSPAAAAATGTEDRPSSSPSGGDATPAGASEQHQRHSANQAGSGSSGGRHASVDTGVSGSSGVGQVVAQATGTSSGQLGLWLPLAILATAAWAVAFLLRTRRQPIS